MHGNEWSTRVKEDLKKVFNKEYKQVLVSQDLLVWSFPVSFLASAAESVMGNVKK